MREMLPRRARLPHAVVWLAPVPADVIAVLTKHPLGFPVDFLFAAKEMRPLRSPRRKHRADAALMPRCRCELETNSCIQKDAATFSHVECHCHRHRTTYLGTAA